MKKVKRIIRQMTFFKQFYPAKRNVILKKTKKSINEWRTVIHPKDKELPVLVVFGKKETNMNEIEEFYKNFQEGIIFK